MILHDLKALVTDLEFLQKTRSELCKFRLIHETDAQTLDRVLKLARSVICQSCGGYGRSMFHVKCEACDGTGSVLSKKMNVNSPTST